MTTQPDFSWTADAQGGDCLIVRGEIDMESSPALLKEIRAGLARRPSHLHVDLAGLRYLDSSGVAVLIQGLKLAQNGRGGPVPFALRAPSAPVGQVLQIAGLNEFFPIVNASDGASGEGAQP